MTWFACVLTRSWSGLVLAFICVVVHLFLSTRRVGEFAFVALVTVSGTLLDSAFMWAGMFVFDGHSGVLCPLWLSAIWAAFATTISLTAKLLADRFWLTALLGAIAGPLAYFAGVRLGAMQFGWSLSLSLATLALVWALLLSLLVLCFRRGVQSKRLGH